MVAPVLVDLVKIMSNSIGTGALTLGPAVPGYRGIEVLSNGSVYSYSIQQDETWEYGTGTWLADSGQFVRSPRDSSDGGTALDLQPNAEIAFVALAEDLVTDVPERAVLVAQGDQPITLPGTPQTPKYLVRQPGGNIAYADAQAANIINSLAGNQPDVGAAVQAVNSGLADRLALSDAETAAGSTFIGWKSALLASSVLRTVNDKLGEAPTSPQDQIATAGTGGDDTLAFRMLAASGARNINLRNLPYNITLNEGDTLFSYTGGKVSVSGTGWSINDNTSYPSHDGAVTRLFQMQATTGVSITGGTYNGPLLATPTVDLGYKGASFLALFGNCQNTYIDMTLNNIRYGVESGNYANPTLGNNDGITGQIRGSMIGYTIAAYYTNNVFVDVPYLNGFHRAMYLAGVQQSGGIIRCQDQYIAPIALLLTDAVTSINSTTGKTTSRASTFATWTIEDTGSSIWQPNSWMAGISCSRMDVMEYHDLDITVRLASSDTSNSTRGVFCIVSNILPYQPSYPFNWEQTCSINRIRISGVLNRSAQTVTEHGIGEIYISTQDSADHGSGNNGTHYALCSKINIDGLKYYPGSGAKPRGFVIQMPGHLGLSVWSGNDFGPATPLTIATNATSQISLNANNLKNTYEGFTGDNSGVSLVNCTINDAGQPTTNKNFVNSPVVGGGSLTQRKIITLNLTGASTTASGALPNNALILGVTGLVTQAFTGATGATIGDGTAAARFGNLNAATAGQSFTPANSTDTAPFYQKGTGNIVVTNKGGAFTAGQIRIIVEYILFNPPTS